MAELRDPRSKHPRDPETLVLLNLSARLLERLVFRGAAHVVTRTARLRNKFLRHHSWLPPAGCTTITNGSDGVDFDVEPLRREPTRLIFLHAGHRDSRLRDPLPLIHTLRWAATEDQLALTRLRVPFPGGEGYNGSDGGAKELWLRVVAGSSVAVAGRTLTRTRLHEANASREALTTALGGALVAERVLARPERYPPGARKYDRKARPQFLLNAGRFAEERDRGREAARYYVASWRHGGDAQPLILALLCRLPRPALACARAVVNGLRPARNAGRR